MRRFVRAAPGVMLWAERIPGPAVDPLLLIADAGMSSVMWPDELVTRLALGHPVIRYDHRDTGRSSAVAADEPYGVAELADDAMTVLDAYDVERAHVLGFGLGGFVAQLMLLDHAARVRSVTLLATGPLPVPGAARNPVPTALARLWAEIDDPRDRESELGWRLAHDRILHGSELPFDAVESRAYHERAMAHAGTDEPITAHVGLDAPVRGGELRTVRLPALVIEGPGDPVFPPPSSAVLADLLGAARVVQVPGMGHLLGSPVAAALAELIKEHTGSTPLHSPAEAGS